jgi:membrane associated rhomboid family serine protease
MDFSKLKSIRTWNRGLIGAVISGGATAITASVTNPTSYTTTTGRAGVAIAAGVSGVIGGILYVKNSVSNDD